MSRSIASTLLVLLASSTVTLSQTTSFPAWLAPANVAASVVTTSANATTYALQCTAECSSIQNGQGTMVNGPSTAAFTQIWLEEGASAQKTLIYDCVVKSANGEAECQVKAGQEGKTGTFTRTTSFKNDRDVVVTAGYEKLGIVIATTTKEVETTVTEKKTTSAPTPKSTTLSLTTSSEIQNTTSSTSTLSGFSNSTSSSASGSSTSTRASSTRSLIFSPTNTGSSAAETSSSAAVAIGALSGNAERYSGLVAGGVLGLWFALF